MQMKILINTPKTRAFLAIVSLLMMSSCSDSKAPINTVGAEHYINQVTSYRKPGAAISLKNTEVTLANSGVEYSVDIDIVSEYSSGELTLTISSSAGLYLFGDKSQTMSLTKGTMHLPFTVIATETGRYYVYMNAQVNQDGLTSGRAMTFIINIGKPDGNGASSKEKASTNEGIIELKAKEEIIQR
jgi:hypothetical protein